MSILKDEIKALLKAAGLVDADLDAAYNTVMAFADEEFKRGYNEGYGDGEAFGYVAAGWEETL